MELKRDVVLAPFTSFKVGGPAEYLVFAKDRGELKDALKYAKKKKLPVTILSGGTNVLIADSGIRGMVILMRMRGIARKGETLDVLAGTSVGELVGYTVREGLGGLAWAGGLPGTVGGAVFGNAGTFGHDIAESLVHVEVVHQRGGIEDLSREACRFGYRTSAFKEEDLSDAAIVSVTLQMTEKDPELLKEEMLDAIRWRNEHQPATNTAGSFFKNPKNPGGLDIPEDKISGQGADETIPVGWLIDSLGLKRVKVGGAYVSEKHANFLMNDGTATAEDILGLAASIKSRVQSEYGIELEEEVRMLGFAERE